MQSDLIYIPNFSSELWPPNHFTFKCIHESVIKQNRHRESTVLIPIQNVNIQSYILCTLCGVEQHAQLTEHSDVLQFYNFLYNYWNLLDFVFFSLCVSLN